MKKQGSQKRKTKDMQLEEFETRDLGDDVRASRVRPVLIRSKSRPTSILLEDDLIEQLRRKGAKRGLAYQTMLKVIVREHLDEY